MMYDRKGIYKKALEVTKKNKLFIIQDIIDLLPISKGTFYEWFPFGSDELDAIKDQIAEEKVKMKIALRRKMFEGERSTETLALYKLICTDEERQALSMTEVKITAGDDAPEFNLELLTDQERKMWFYLYDKACGKEITIDTDYEELDSLRDALEETN
jgi:hypothetical protein